MIVIPLIVVLSVPSLAQFGSHWTVAKDAIRYLSAGSELALGRGLYTTHGLPFNGGHGPGLPALICALILVFGRDIAALAWAIRLLALLNALLAYFLVKRLSGPLAGLIAAALLTLFCSINLTFNIDTVLLTFCLSALLALLGAISRNSPTLALLSGVFLGVAILTKESAIVYSPLALLAVLLLGWELRGALWHYLGVVLVCLPWWAWDYSATGDLYLIDHLPSSLRLPFLGAMAAILAIGALMYTTGMVNRYLAGERRRLWTGRLVVLAWTVSLTGLALYAGAPALAEASSGSLKTYLTDLLAPAIVVVPVLILVGGYTLWKVFGRDGPWTLFALALLFQVPVCVLVLVEQWSPRQYLILQALLSCALAALVADAASAPSRGGAYAARLTGGMLAAVLIVVLVAASVGRVLALLPEDPLGGLSEHHEVSPQAAGMVRWMDHNVPEGQQILVNVAQGNYLAYLDGGRHEWTFLRLDQDICESRPNLQISCDPGENATSRIPHDAIWVQMKGDCRVISLSITNLLEQVSRTGSGYVMISGNAKYPGILKLSSLLQESGAFQVVRAEGRSSAKGVVLLERTGRAPEAVPTLINKNTLTDLKRCEPAKGRAYSNWLRFTFPNGIRKTTASD